MHTTTQTAPAPSDPAKAAGVLPATVWTRKDTETRYAVHCVAERVDSGGLQLVVYRLHPMHAPHTPLLCEPLSEFLTRFEKK